MTEGIGVLVKIRHLSRVAYVRKGTGSNEGCGGFESAGRFVPLSKPNLEQMLARYEGEIYICKCA